MCYLLLESDAFGMQPLLRLFKDAANSPKLSLIDLLKSVESCDVVVIVGHLVLCLLFLARFLGTLSEPSSCE